MSSVTISLVAKPARLQQTTSRLSARALSNSAAQHTALPFSLRTGKESAARPDVDGGKMLRMIMFGKPGAGKGTLSARLVKKYDILALSTGDMLRQHIAEKTEVGRQAEEIVARGALLPDELMLQVVTSKLAPLKNKHWILDGFPRTLGQGQSLDAHLKTQGTPLSLIVNLDVPDSVILSRISDRWVHVPSGRVYNMSYNRPKVEGLDDVTGEPLTKRPDDNPDTFVRRLDQFYASTSPLLQYYSSKSASTSDRTKLVTLQGTTSDEIWPKLEGAVRSSFPNLKERAETQVDRRKHSLSDAMAAGWQESRKATDRTGH